MLNKYYILRLAINHAMGELDLDADYLGEIVRNSGDEINAICKDKNIDVGKLKFLRMYESLYILYGGHTENMQGWFKCHNTRLGGVPMELCRTPEGLEQVTMVLEAYRYGNI